MQTRTLNDRYRLDELIGEGGMAIVYRGYDLVLNRDVAVKLLRDQYGSDDSFLARFDREAQSAARLSHPNVVNVYDVGEDDSVRYIVMEHIEGANLKDLIRRQGPFTVEGSAFVVRQIANGLDYAHARGLVHRDIKPQNILVDDNGSVKVVDFGIAKGISDTNLTDVGTGMGTVHYVSPEQAKGEPATPLSDVYSTGVVLFEMLTGTLPYEADSQVGVAMQHVSAPIPSAYDRNPDLPPDVDDLIHAAMAKNPMDRFGSAGELADAVESLTVGGSGATRIVPGGAAAGVAGAPPRRRGVPPAGRGRGPTPPRAGNFRDDVGCVTWLIGSAILIGLIGLVILAFRLGDFGLFEPTVGQNAGEEPTPTTVVDLTPSPEVTPDETPTPEATPEETPTPEPTPTAEPTTELVPDLVDATVEQARQAITVGEFELEIEEVFSNSVPQGRIISQVPAPESELDIGGTIAVQVSRGPEFHSVPEVAGRPASEAMAQLNQLPITVNESLEASRNIPEGHVIRTEPTGQIRTGSTLVMVVSRGDVVQVPDVFRMPLSQGVAQLEAAGLVVGTQGAQSCSFIQNQNPNFDCGTFPDGHIVSGTLQWNAWVDRGSTIDIGYFDAEAD